MGSRIQLQSVAVVPSSGGELEYALFCRMRAGSQLHIVERRRWLYRCSSEMYGRFGLRVRRRQWSGGSLVPSSGRPTWSVGLPLKAALLHTP